jgi:prepilin-type N-terminal cleavage/methylation domain-containing protein
MQIKKWFSRPNSGFSLLELLVASGIASTVLLVAFGTVGQFYFSQKKINYSQDFYAESRFLMERVVQTIRDNTIDYDRFFAEVGPTGCSNFFLGADNQTTNIASFRSQPQAYEKIFYWDTNPNGESLPDRNLGGVNLDGDIDPCAQTFQGVQSNLFLINGSQTIQTAFRKQSDDSLQLQVRLGVDTDNDGRADAWGIPDTNCLINGKPPLGLKNLLGSVDEFCARAHDWTTISPKALKVLQFSFLASPDRDPFLNFRNDAAQVHPNVRVSLETQLADAEQNGIDPAEAPTILLQTTASSRVFGDIRK